MSSTKMSRQRRVVDVDRILERVVGPILGTATVVFLYWALWVTG